MTEAGGAPRLQAGHAAERGRAARAAAPRSSHGEWAPAADRRDPVSVLEDQAADRISELLPIRYGRMLSSPFAFFRGAAAVMAEDLAATPTSGLRVQTCGDAHIANFGGFAAPDRRLIFDLNDFDETLPGPWEWDVKRMAASIEIAARERGMASPVARQEVVMGVVREYRKTMREFAQLGHLGVWYARMDQDSFEDRFAVEVGAAERRQLDRAATKARRKDNTRALTKLTHHVGGHLRFLSQPPLLVPVEELLPPEAAAHETERVADLIREYVASLPNDCAHLLDGYEYVHMARKVVGVGSVGTRAWIVLLEGRDAEDALVLQAKEAVASVLEPFAGASTLSSNGERVVHGQRLMQAASDIFLGWTRAEGLDRQFHDFYVRQLWDWKASGDILGMTDRAFPAYCRACAWTLARAHARTGDRFAITAYLGSGPSFDKAIARFASAYAEQNLLDHAALAAAEASGRIAVEHDV